MRRRSRLAIVIIVGGFVLGVTIWPAPDDIRPSTQLQSEAAVATSASTASSGPPMYTLPYTPALPHGPQILRMLAGVPQASGSSRPRGDSSGTLEAMTTPATGDAAGIDVADFQHESGPIDWPQVAADGYSFVYIKATEGNYYNNPYYPGDFAGSRAAGMLAGAYTFANPSSAGGSAEADYLLNAIHYSNDGQTLPPMVDLEEDPYDASTPCYGLSTSALVSWISSFVSEVVARISRLPLIYTDASWWQQCTGGTSAFSSDPLNVASYGTSTPTLPKGWSNYIIWQFSSTGSVPGISSQTDEDRFNGSVSSLRQFATNGQGTAQELPSPVGQSNGVVDVFWRGSATNLDHEWYVPGSGWHGPESMGGSLGSDPDAVSTGGGNLQVLYEGAGGGLWTSFYRAGAWHGPQALNMGTLGGAPRAVSAQAGVVDVFWRGSNNGLWHAWEINGAWAGPQELAPSGSVASDPAPVSLGQAGGPMDVFWRGANGGLYDVQYRGGWSSPQEFNMGTLGSQPEGVKLQAGEVEEAWAGTDENIWYAVQTSSGIVGPTSGGDGPLASDPQLASGEAGAADLFWRGANGEAWYASQSGGGSWSGAHVLPSGVMASQPVPTASSARTLDVFWRGRDGGLWHAWGYNGDWAGPQRLGPGHTFG